MKAPVKSLVIASALSVLAGGAIAKQIEDFHCRQAKCAYNVELGPSQTKTLRGYCDASHATGTNSSMVCHAVKGMTCALNGFFGDYWSCLCTNWETKRQYTTIDVYCPES